MSVSRGMRALARLPIVAGALSAQVAMALVPSANLPVGTETSVTVALDIAQDPAGSALPVADDATTTAAAAALHAATSVAPVAETAAAVPIDASEVECVAKVIVHEAGREPARGQVAVAQVIRTRLKAGRFGGTACAVTRQRGQFFDVDAYNPSRDTPQWLNAVAIARDTLAGGGEEVAPGALFFHAATSRGRWVGNRARVAQIGAQVFYR